MPKYPLTYGLLKAKLPLIPVEVKGNSLCFLLDTGATHNILDSKVASYFEEIITPVGEGNLISLAGITEAAKRVNLPFTFEGKEYDTIFTVFDTTNSFEQVEKESGIPIHGLLGTEFLLEHEWTINFETLELIF